MTFIQGPLDGESLDEIADEIFNAELEMELKSLRTNQKDGKNFAFHEDPADTPETGITILPAPAVGPTGSTKICDGKLTIGGQAIDVTAFRLK